MNKAFEKILDRLEAKKQYFQKFYEADGKTEEDECINKATQLAFDDAKNIVQEVEEEYNDGWIPCSERLPDEAFGCLVTVMDCEPSTQTDFKNILPYFVGYDSHSWNDADGNEIPFEVIAWQKLPETYKESEYYPLIK